MRQEEGDAALEDRAPAEGEELLGDRTAEPPAPAAGSNNRRDMHGSECLI
jgi:hypothetical protein